MYVPYVLEIELTHHPAYAKTDIMKMEIIQIVSIMLKFNSIQTVYCK